MVHCLRKRIDALEGRPEIGRDPEVMKLRLECLKLARSLYSDGDQDLPVEAADQMVEEAARFMDFVRGSRKLREEPKQPDAP